MHSPRLCQKLFAYLVLFALSLGGLTGCVSFSEEVTYHFTQAKGEVWLRVYQSKAGPHLNIHGGNSDTYSFTLPAMNARVPGTDIIRYWENYRQVDGDFSRDGYLVLEVNAEQCRLTINLRQDNGKSHVLNGVHLLKNCGQR